MKIEEMDVSQVYAYDGNPRDNDAAVDAVANSIKEFGFKVPIIIDRNNVIIAGHTRLKAAEKIGLQKVPVIRANDLSDEQVKAFRLADNKVAELSEWDFGLLAGELEGIDDIDMSLFGFDLPADEDEAQEAAEDEYEFKDNVPHFAKPGDVFALGGHRLMCGDASVRADVEKLVGAARAKMVFTDPPYGVAIGDKNRVLNARHDSARGHRIETNIDGDTMEADDLFEMLHAAFVNLREFSADDCAYYVTSPQGGEIGPMMETLAAAGLRVRHNIIWVKNQATFSMRRLDYDYKHEPIFYTWTKRHNFYGAGKYKTSVWEFDKPRKNGMHPTMKPVELVGEALLNSSLTGDPVFDFFGGSGTTLIACEQLGRVCYMMEKDEKFVDVIIDRWQEMTGGKAAKL